MSTSREIDSIAILAQELLEKAHLRGDSRFMLGLTGPPGAGKTTLAQDLHDELCSLGVKSTVVPMDGFHLDNETLLAMGIHHLKGVEESFDAEGFVQLLKRIKEETDRPVAFPTFDRSKESVIENSGLVPPSERLVIVEGNYLLSSAKPWHQIRCCLDEIWYVDAPDEILLSRLLSRHMKGGKTKDQALEKVSSTDLPNAKKIELLKESADRVILL